MVLVRYIRVIDGHRAEQYRAESRPIAVQDLQLGFEVDTGTAGQRTVRVKFSEAGGSSEALGDPQTLPTSMSENSFFVSFVHERFGKVRNTAGPASLAATLRDNADDGSEACPGGTAMKTINAQRSSYGEVHTCLPKGRFFHSGVGFGERLWFDFQNSNLFGGSGLTFSVRGFEDPAAPDQDRDVRVSRCQNAFSI